MNKSQNIRAQFSLVIHLFYEGETELDYLQKFIQERSTTTLVRLNKIKQSPNPKYLVQQAIEKYPILKNNKKDEIWVVFDHDGREKEIKEAIDLLKKSQKDIHLAFMKPCIEIWPLLHNRIDNVISQEQAQSELEKIMPSYKHDRNPKFDLKKMPDYRYAKSVARSWDISLDGVPEYHASKFAGIYKLTEKIITTRNK